MWRTIDNATACAQRVLRTATSGDSLRLDSTTDGLSYYSDHASIPPHEASGGEPQDVLMGSRPVWMIYGAYGYSGALIARQAKERGLAPILGGRDGTRLRVLASDLALPSRLFPLESPDSVATAIDGLQLILHCAGPFSATSRPMVDACLRTRTHYLDLTGELSVIDALLGRDAAAREAGIVLMPSVGFDVVATECVALMLREQLPDATDLMLGIAGKMRPSPGTAKTAVEGLALGWGALRNGRRVGLRSPLIKHVRIAGKERTMISVLPGDLEVAYRSTGIPNITMYLEMPPTLMWLGMAMNAFPLTRGLLKQQAQRLRGPSAEERRSRRVWVWGRAENATGTWVEATLELPDPYDVTVHAALSCVARVLAGDAEPGAASPGQAFGTDLVMDLLDIGSLSFVPLR